MIREKLAAKRSEEASGFRWRAGDVSRLEQFSDAVFAFAMALLVVSVDVPKNSVELLAILREFPAFGITFAVLIWIWHNHFIYFRRFGFVDSLTTSLNAVLLFVILFYVYPMKYLFGALLNGFFGGGWGFTFGQGRIVLTVYSAGFATVFGMFALLYGHALRMRQELELNEVELLITRASMSANLYLALLGIVSAASAWFGPPWITPFAGFLYAGIGPLMWWHWSRVDRQWKRLAPRNAGKPTATRSASARLAVPPE